VTAENPPYGVQADSHSAELFRRAISTLFGGVGGNNGGIVAPGDLLVSAGSGNSLNVAAGEIWIPGSSASHMGAYYGYNDAPVTVGVTPDGSNPLYAIVTASVNDQAYTGNPSVTNNTWNLLVTQGTAAPSPSVPATPANSLLLATVLVPAGAPSSASYTIADDRIVSGISLAGQPAGRIYATVQTVVATVTWAQIALAATDFLRGGMTVASNSLIIPATGIYSVSVGLGWQSGGGAIQTNRCSTAIRKNGTEMRHWEMMNTAATFAAPGGCDLVPCIAGDALELYGYQSASGGMGSNPGSVNTFLSAALVSA
jgi:hypothetical protein